MNYRNLNLALLHQLDCKGQSPAVLRKENGAYQNISYDGLKEITFSVAAGLMSEGLNYRDTVVIISNTRPEWIFADMGSLFSGAVISAAFPSASEEETANIINDVQAKFVFVENTSQVNKIMRIRDQIPTVKKVFVFDTSDLNRNGWVESFRTLIDRGANWKEQETNIRAVSEMIEPNDLLTIVYTSGTSGQPKGVELTHLNYLVTIESLLKFSHAFQDIQRNLSFLPLANALERVSGYYIMLYNGRTIGYVESFEKLMDNFTEVKPDFVIGVPRVYEKVHTRLTYEVKRSSGIQKAIFNWALKIGKKVVPYKIASQPLSGRLKWQYKLANVLVFKKVKERFGGRVKFFVSGGAPLNKEIAEFFYALDILILEGWGSTEGTAPFTFNRPEEFRFGTVGKAIPGVEIKRDEDGELLVKGPSIFKQYHNLDKKTAKSFTADGFFRTGDIGEIDEEGWVKVTDRKKQLIVISDGKKIAPAVIQQLLSSHHLIEHAHIHGDGKKYLVALVTVDRDVARRFAIKNNITTEPEELAAHPMLKQKIQAHIASVNDQLEPDMQIKDFRIVRENFSTESNELTAMHKIKADVVEQKYADLIESMYEEELVLKQ